MNTMWKKDTGKGWSWALDLWIEVSPEDAETLAVVCKMQDLADNWSPAGRTKFSPTDVERLQELYCRLLDGLEAEVNNAEKQVGQRIAGQPGSAMTDSVYESIANLRRQQRAFLIEKVKVILERLNRDVWCVRQALRQAALDSTALTP